MSDVEKPNFKHRYAGRNTEIFAAFQSGSKVVHLAKAYGLSVTRVREIVGREQRRRKAGAA